MRGSIPRKASAARVVATACMLGLTGNALADGKTIRAEIEATRDSAKRIDASPFRIGPAVSLERGVFGSGGVWTAHGLHRMLGTVGQMSAHSPGTTGPEPITHRICSGWWCVEVSRRVDAPTPETPGQIEFGLPGPNPTNGALRLAFALPREARVDARLLDVLGRRVRNLANHSFPAGRHTLEWDGRDAHGHQAPAGVYFMRLAVDGREVGGRRVVVIR